MKEIFIVLTHTGTTLSKIIKIYTKDEFSHISIALDEELNEMYSFGRLKPYNPFIGGFVHEYIDKGTFKRFFNTKTKIYSLKITESQYESVKENIKQIEENKEKYKFNIIGLFAVAFNKKIEKEHSFYCAEFVKHVMEKAGIETKLSKIIKPDDFKKLDGLQQIYEGLLRKYKSKSRHRLSIQNNCVLYENNI